MRKRPDREDYFSIGVVIFLITLLWGAYSYQYCDVNPSCGLDSFKEWQSFFGALMTIVAALIGGFFVVRSSNRQMALISDQFSEVTRPFVIARLTTRAGTVFVLEIENTGQTPATDLTLEINKDFFQFGESRNIRDFPAFNRTVPHFAPREKLIFDLSQGFNMSNFHDGVDRTPRQFTVKVKYCGQGKAYNESYEIDVEHYFSTLAAKNPQDHLEDISRHLKKISETKSQL